MDSKQIGDCMHKWLFNKMEDSICMTTTRELNVDITLDSINDMLNFVENNRPYYEDKDKQYLCLIPITMPQEVVHACQQYKNVAVKVTDNLPAQDSIYFLDAEHCYLLFDRERYGGEDV